MNIWDAEKPAIRSSAFGRIIPSIPYLKFGQNVLSNTVDSSLRTFASLTPKSGGSFIRVIIASIQSKIIRIGLDCFLLKQSTKVLPGFHVVIWHLAFYENLLGQSRESSFQFLLFSFLSHCYVWGL